MVQNLTEGIPTYPDRLVMVKQDFWFSFSPFEMRNKK